MKWLKAYARWAVGDWLGVSYFILTAGWVMAVWFTLCPAKRDEWDRWIDDGMP